VTALLSLRAVPRASAGCGHRSPGRLGTRPTRGPLSRASGRR